MFSLRTSRYRRKCIDRLEQLLSLTRARIIRVDAQLHDEIVGAVSHLPHIIAVALVNQVARYNDANPLYEAWRPAVSVT